MRRKFDNQDLVLPNGEVARIGTHMNEKGEITIKLRLPNDYWGVTQIFRAAKGTKYKGGKFVVVIDKV
jgi:hypothetical protein